MSSETKIALGLGAAALFMWWLSKPQNQAQASATLLNSTNNFGAGGGTHFNATAGGALTADTAFGGHEKVG